MATRAWSEPPDRIGEYRIVGELSSTPASRSYVGVHMLLPRQAVLKVMTNATQRFAVRVLREAYFLEALQHPGIVRLYESALLADRRPWFACELVEGPTLAQVIASGASDRPDVVALLRDLAEVLEHAHHRGVIHTNLRPDRIVLTAPERGFPVCITDWSDARAHDAAAMPYTPSPASWHFTAPEVVRGDAVDDRADVFALGVIAYQLMTGNVPFEKGAIANGAFVPTGVRCPEAPGELTAMVDQMLSIDRFDRPSTGAVASDLSWLTEMIAAPARGARGTGSIGRLRKPRWTPQMHVAQPIDETERTIPLDYIVDDDA